MDHIAYIDQVLEIKQDSYEHIQPFTIDLDSSTYTVKFKLSENHFIAESSGSDYFLQILNPSPDKLLLIESELKERESLSSIVSGLKKSVHKFGSDLIIKSELSRKISLRDYFTHTRDPRIPHSLKEKTELCVDVIIKALHQVISSISLLERSNIKVWSLMPEDIYIEITNTPFHPITTLNGIGVEIKIDFIGSNPLEQPQMQNLSGLALCLFSALKNKACKSVNLESKKLQNCKMSKGYPNAICSLVNALMKPECKAQEILFSPMISTWLYLFKDDDLITSELEFNIDALLAGLYFKDKTSRIKSALTLLRQEKEGAARFLKEENAKRMINSICRYKNWSHSPELLKTAITILKHLIEQNENLLACAGPLKLYKALLMPEYDRDIISKVCSTKTMTGACIISDSPNLISKLFMEKSSHYYQSIIPFMSYRVFSYYLQDRCIFKPTRVLNILGKIPIKQRRMRPKETIELIKKYSGCVQKWSTKLINRIVRTVRETLYEGKIVHDCNKSGKCYKNEKKLNSSVLMVYCSRCDLFMCLVCASSHTESHSEKYIKYEHSAETCKKVGESFEIIKEALEPTEISLTFFDSLGNVNSENVFSSGRSSEEISITSSEEITAIYDDSRHHTLLYYEVEILNAGFSENISIGIDGIGVFYSGYNGMISNTYGDSLKRAARFGTGDVIGIGLTSSHFLYYTYNGFNLHLYTECTEVNDIRPLVKIKGKGITVRIITKNFYFSQSPYPKELSIHSPEVRAMIQNWVEKCDDNQEELIKLRDALEGINGFEIRIPTITAGHKQNKDKNRMNGCKDTCVVS